MDAAELGTPGESKATVIHGCDQRAPLVEFRHPAFPQVLRFVQRGATSEDFVQGTSSVLWPAATKLAEHFCTSAAPSGAPWMRCRALEVGAGLGLTGATLGALGAQVVLSDCEVAMPLLRTNQELLAESNVQLQVRRLDWGSNLDEEALLTEFGQFDLIVGSDIILSSFDLDKLFSSCCALLCRSADARLILAFEFREDWQAISDFIAWAEAANMKVQHEELGDPDDEIYLYTFRWDL